jgi:anti-sigma regulatory factor (Ser/Thr protein kinase)
MPAAFETAAAADRIRDAITGRDEREPGNGVGCENGRMRLNRASLGNASHHGRISRAGVAGSPVPAAPVTGTLRHVGFFYRTTDEYARTVAAFLRAGIAIGEPAFAAVPPGNLGVVRDALGPDARHVGFADMTLMGRNPAWIIPRVREFTGRHAGKRVRYLGEPIWAARNAAELREATRHEALINLAFATMDVEVLCPYDAVALDQAILADARRTHPVLLSDGRLGASPGYAAPFRIPSSCSLPLPPPPHGAMSHTYRSNLSEVRALVLEHARAAGLSEARASDLMLAVSEVAANTLRHTSSDGTLTSWHDHAEIVCQVRDKGIITDPLAGRRRPPRDADGGHGLWLVHQVCDLVELRSDTSGTTVRMHMAIHPQILPAAAAPTEAFMW